MASPSGVSHPKHKWYSLAIRHLRMASRLLNMGFADGAFFHTYHAFECAISAVIAAKGYPVPPDGKTVIYVPRARPIQYYTAPSGQLRELSTHKVRFILFDELADHSKPYHTRYATLSRFLTNDDRNFSLYYDHNTGRLPHERYNHSYVLPLYQNVRKLTREVRPEIH